MGKRVSVEDNEQLSLVVENPVDEGWFSRLREQMWPVLFPQSSVSLRGCSFNLLIDNNFCVVIGAFVDLIGVCCVSLSVEIN